MAQGMQLKTMARPRSVRVIALIPQCVVTMKAMKIQAALNDLKSKEMRMKELWKHDMKNIYSRKAAMEQRHRNIQKSKTQ